MYFLNVTLTGVIRLKKMKRTKLNLMERNVENAT
jgi:hypothetical protein